MTNVSIAGLIAVALAVAVMWIIAITDGHARLLLRGDGLPAEFRSNHVPWRHARVLGVLYDFALLGTLFGVLSAGWLGAAVERTRRARIVAALAMVMLVVNCAHFPLFD